MIGESISWCIMAETCFNPDKLARLLAPQGFALNLPESTKNGISFVRASCVERLYDHVLIKAKSRVYAETVISAASFTTCLACVSERDNRFRAFLAGEDSKWAASTIVTSAEAQAWLKKLVENTDAYCTSIAVAKGPQLVQRLQAVLNAVDSYVQRLGDMFAILDREFAFFSEASPDEQSEAGRLATLARQMIYLNSENANLASLALVRYGSDVEGHYNPFHAKVPHRDEGLAARLILLVDYVRRKRLEYDVAGGLSR